MNDLAATWQLMLAESLRLAKWLARANMYNNAMKLCLDQDARWVSSARAAVAGLGYGAPEDAPTRAVLQREAFDHALLGQYRDAAAAIQQAVSSDQTDRTRGWLKEQLADYTHHFNPTEAQQIQLSAQKLNRHVTKPMDGVAYVKIGQVQPQAVALSGLLQSSYSDPNSMILGFNAILDDLVFQPNSFRRFESAVCELGKHLGFESHRPEVEYGRGPDNLWAIGEQRFVIIECKNEAVAKEISKQYVDKSSGRRQWFKSMYGPGCSADSVIVHPSVVVSRSASPEQNLRVMTESKLEELKTGCRRLATNLASISTFLDIDGIGKALNARNLSSDRIVMSFTEPFKMSSGSGS